MTSENPFYLALSMIASADPNLVEITSLSLRVSGLSAALALLCGLPLGALIATKQFIGRSGVIVFFNALLGLPPVVVGVPGPGPGPCPLVPPGARSTGPPWGPGHWSPLGLGPLGAGPGSSGPWDISNFLIVLSSI